MIKIGAIGYNYCHKDNFCADNPNGPGAWLFLLIKSDALLTLRGREYAVKPGTVCFISPNTPCSYRAKDGEYTDDWFYFEGMDGEETERFKSMKITVDEPIYIGSFAAVSGLIYTLTVEFYSANIYHDENVELYTRILLNMISRSIIEGTFSERGISTAQKEHLHYIRTWIYHEPKDVPTVAILARSFGMSLSSLEHLYTKIFGISIKQDIINSRMSCAKRLLLSTNLSVAEVGEKCGYQSSYGFMRQFKQYVGMTPTEYRKTQPVGK